MMPKDSALPQHITFYKSCLRVSQLLPDWSLILWSCREFDSLGKTLLTLSCVFHSFGVRMAVRGVEIYFPSPRPLRIGGVSILNDNMTIDCYFVILIFAAFTSSLCDSNVYTISLVKICR